MIFLPNILAFMSGPHFPPWTSSITPLASFSLTQAVIHPYMCSKLRSQAPNYQFIFLELPLRYPLWLRYRWMSTNEGPSSSSSIVDVVTPLTDYCSLMVPNCIFILDSYFKLDFMVDKASMKLFCSWARCWKLFSSIKGLVFGENLSMLVVVHL